ncbi:hypothetical protein L6164_002788 [Bauhinia variegata]|uniref:Uncharacterized protein n=1 Tax=Bauhinia variegata TaxID=167791 RepID=A0ACB9PZV8_BAUVA|nr:hypothetical protein L6164_002788 [Bauhinia variegata]
MFHNATATNPNSSFSNEEGNALRKSQWWNTSDYLFNSSNHCLWSGIKCNEAGSITAIYAPPNPVSRRNEFGDINLTAFPNLELLDLSGMGLKGSIPAEIATLPRLKFLILFNNLLSGEILSTFSNFTQLQELDLSRNHISVVIPSQIGNLTNLLRLDLSYNNLCGHLFLGIESLKNLVWFDLSWNMLAGPVPPKLGSLKNLTDIYLGNNIITGQIPSSLGHLKHLEALDLGDIIQATEDFDIKYCIGTGGYGSVYRAKLPMGRIVALKKLHRMEYQNPRFARSFQNEIKMLTKIRHRNIVKLHGFCLHNRCMFLIYEHIERGSLFCALNNDVEAQQLNWGKRVNIIKRISHALACMHHDFLPAIIDSTCLGTNSK